MISLQRLILLNQMAGPMFRELAEDLSLLYPKGCLLLTGHPDTLARARKITDNLVIRSAPCYDRRSHTSRFISWLQYLLASTRYLMFARKGDVFLVVSNPPLLGPWVWFLSLFRNISFAILVYDVYPDLLVRLRKINEANIFIRLWRWLNRQMYKKANIVIALHKRMAEILEKQFFPRSGQLIIIPPWADTEKIRLLPIEKNPYAGQFVPDDKYVVLYSGNMGISHDIDSILEAVRKLKKRQDIVFLIIGEGERFVDVKKAYDEEQLTNMRLYSFQPEDKLPFTMALASISIVSVEGKAENLMLPSKVFYYMSAGSAVIGICNPKNELRNIIENNNCGVCLMPKNPNLLVSAIEKMIDDSSQLAKYQQNARKAAECFYSRQICVGRFVKAFGHACLLPLKKNNRFCGS